MNVDEVFRFVFFSRSRDAFGIFNRRRFCVTLYCLFADKGVSYCVISCVQSPCCVAGLCRLAL